MEKRSNLKLYLTVFAIAIFVASIELVIELNVAPKCSNYSDYPSYSLQKTL